MKRLLALILLCLLALGCAGPDQDQGPGGDGPGFHGGRGGPGGPGGPGRPGGLPEQLDQYLALLHKRLRLSPEQEALASPVIQAELDKRSEIRKRYQYSDPREAMRSMAQEERQLQKETLAKLAEVLSPTQLDALRKLQEESSRPPGGPAGRGGGRPGRGMGDGMMN